MEPKTANKRTQIKTTANPKDLYPCALTAGEGKWRRGKEREEQVKQEEEEIKERREETLVRQG